MQDMGRLRSPSSKCESPIYLPTLTLYVHLLTHSHSLRPSTYPLSLSTSIYSPTLTLYVHLLTHSHSLRPSTYPLSLSTSIYLPTLTLYLVILSLALSHSLTHSLTQSLTHSLTHPPSLLNQSMSMLDVCHILSFFTLK
jgi:hypothetical protein